MTRKHFLMMAERIAKMKDRFYALIVAEAFADVAKDINPRFDRQKFYDACGLRKTVDALGSDAIIINS